ncbi:developmentally regulated gtp-binding protein-related [Holotrichia oblita]|nr:developmentally regulated gtp-binding protein-related [Holotrichia oblita]
MDNKYADFVFDTLSKDFVDAKSELNFKNNYELLIAVILSAQCTDKRVNMVTPVLFAKYKNPYELASANPQDVEEIIKTTGFYRNKTKNIIAACRSIVNDFNGEVPGRHEDLVKLAGVGQKTANVLVSVGFGGDAIAVDTHVFRVSHRLGFSSASTPEKVEEDLKKIYEKSKWSELHHMLVLFGRYKCKAMHPECDGCKFAEKSGNGGNGIVSFHREKFVARGGPDGGNGGSGGNVIFKVAPDLNNLITFRYERHYRAENGMPGDKKNMSGKGGKDVLVYVPKGTIIRDADTNLVIADIYEPDKDYIILKGGRGGRGNAVFATATRQSPHFSQDGEKTTEYAVILELKTIADVGIIGYPNVGKSTLLSVVSAAKPKIANYYFTTLSPNLGVVKYYDKSFVVADIPGLIEGASEGIGLGHDFLRHIERTRMLIHVVDISGFDGRDPYNDYLVINKELKDFSEKLSKLPQIIALNKCDIAPPENIENFKKQIGKKAKVITVSALSRNNIEDLIKQTYEILKDIPMPEPIPVEQENFDARDITSVEIIKLDEGYYEVTGGYITNLIRGIVLSDYSSAAYFQKRLREDKILDKLREAGAQNGDTRAILKSVAAKEDAVCHIGKEGLTDAVVTGILQALAARELVKISVNQACDTDAKILAQQLSEKTKADIVDIIGRKIVIYNFSEDKCRKLNKQIIENKIDFEKSFPHITMLAFNVEENDINSACEIISKTLSKNNDVEEYIINKITIAYDNWVFLDVKNCDRLIKIHDNLINALKPYAKSFGYPKTKENPPHITVGYSDNIEEIKKIHGKKFELKVKPPYFRVGHEPEPAVVNDEILRIPLY